MTIKHSQALINKCREMRFNGERVKVISTVTGIPVSTIYQIVNGVVRVDGNKARDSKPGFRPWFSVDVAFLRQNAGQMTAKEIADRLGRSIDSVRTMAKKENISLSLAEKVDSHDEWLCCELYKEGLAIGIIAEKMELKRRTVSQIIKSYGVR